MADEIQEAVEQLTEDLKDAYKATEQMGSTMDYDRYEPNYQNLARAVGLTASPASTDSYTKAQMDTLLAAKADTATTYTKNQVNDLLAQRGIFTHNIVFLGHYSGEEFALCPQVPLVNSKSSEYTDADINAVLKQYEAMYPDMSGEILCGCPAHYFLDYAKNHSLSFTAHNGISTIEWVVRSGGERVIRDLGTVYDPKIENLQDKVVRVYY